MARGTNSTSETDTVATRARALSAIPEDTFSGGIRGFHGELPTPDDKAWYVEGLRQQLIAASVYKSGTMGQLQRQSEAVAWAWRNGASEAELCELSGLSTEDVRECIYEAAYEQGRLDAFDTMDY
jgi:hypothetical protein